MPKAGLPNLHFRHFALSHCQEEDQVHLIGWSEYTAGLFGAANLHEQLG
jgi:hypothetical protein